MNEPQTWADLQDTGNAQAQLVLLAIARHADWDTSECYPSRKRLAEMAKCSLRTVDTYLARLEADGIIERSPRYREAGSQTTNMIRFVGYQEWLAALRNGGTVKAPKTVKKYTADPPAESAPPPSDPLANSAPPPSNMSAPPPSKHAAPLERHSNVTSPTAPLPPQQEEAPSSGQSMKVESKGSGIARPRIAITSEFPSWPHWLDRIERDRGPEARRAVELLGRLEVAARWPTDDTPTPVVTIIRNPSGVDA